MTTFNQFTIPFGRYIDSNTLGDLKLVKYKERVLDPHLADDLYLIKDIKSGIYYCALESDQDSEPDYYLSIAKGIMYDFVASELSNDFEIELLNPKNKDWLPTHYVARVHSKQSS